MERKNNDLFEVKSKLWIATHRSTGWCSACDLNKTLTFTLIGGCRDTSFGKNLFSYKAVIRLIKNFEDNFKLD